MTLYKVWYLNKYTDDISQGWSMEFLLVNKVCEVSDECICFIHVKAKCLEKTLKSYFLK